MKVSKVQNLLAAAMLASFCGAAVAGDVTVNVSGVPSAEGNVAVRITHEDNFDSFPSDDYEEEIIVPSNTDGVTVTFKGLEAGIYAVAFYHDANGNKALDMNMLGIPQEPVDNSGKKAMMKPDFWDSSFDVTDEDMTLEVSFR